MANEEDDLWGGGDSNSKPPDTDEHTGHVHKTTGVLLPVDLNKLEARNEAYATHASTPGIDHDLELVGNLSGTLDNRAGVELAKIEAGTADYHPLGMLGIAADDLGFRAAAVKLFTKFEVEDAMLEGIGDPALKEAIDLGTHTFEVFAALTEKAFVMGYTLGQNKALEGDPVELQESEDG